MEKPNKIKGVTRGWEEKRGGAPGPDVEAQGLGWGRLSPRDRGPLASSVGGCCLQPTVMPKVNEVSCVWMQDAVHTPVLTAARTAEEPGASSAETPGRGARGQGTGRGWAPGSEGLWACLCSWVLCLFLGV